MYTKSRRPVIPIRSLVPTEEEKYCWNRRNEEGPAIGEIVSDVPGAGGGAIGCFDASNARRGIDSPRLFRG
jgi:hypothetical protein